MKHIRTLTQQQPQAAQTVLGIKLEALGTAVPAAVRIWNQKFNGGAVPR